MLLSAHRYLRWADSIDYPYQLAPPHLKRGFFGEHLTFILVLTALHPAAARLLHGSARAPFQIVTAEPPVFHPLLNALSGSRPGVADSIAGASCAGVEAAQD